MNQIHDDKIISIRNKKTKKKCQYHGYLHIDEIHITDSGTQWCLLCKQNKPNTIEAKKNIKEFPFNELKCKICNETKPIEQFYTRSKYIFHCKSCIKIRKHEYRKRPEVKEREYISYMKRFYKNKYGISFEDYEAMLKKQNGLCAICRNPSTRVDARSKKIQRLNIDHCHTTRKVRGLLCSKCNHGIGLFGDNILLFESCIRYIQHGYIDDKFIQRIDR
jgi:Recombination endonuclease VII